MKKNWVLPCGHPPVSTQRQGVACSHPPVSTQRQGMACGHPPVSTQRQGVACSHPPVSTQRPLALQRLLALFCPLALLFLLFTPALASTTPAPELSGFVDDGLSLSGAEELVNQLTPESQRLLSEFGVESLSLGELLSLSPKAFFKALGDRIASGLGAPLRLLGVVLGVLITGSLLRALTPEKKGGTAEVFSAVAVLAVIGAMAEPLCGAILDTAATLKGCSNFMLSFIPVFCSVLTVSGAPISAGGYQLLLFSVCQLVSVFASSVLVPFLGVYMGLSVAGGVSDDMGVLPLAKGVRQVVTWSLTLLMTAYVGLLSMQTLVSSGADAAMLKTGKFLVGSFVPVVGGAISEAVGAAQGALSLMRASVGVYGVLALCAAFLPTMLSVGMWYLAAKAGSFIAEALGQQKPRVVLEAAAGCLGMMQGILASFMLLVIMSVVVVLNFCKGG